MDTCGDKQKKPIPMASPSEPYALEWISEWLPFKWTQREGEGAGTWFTKHTASEASGHPVSAERVTRLRAELKRWEREREKRARSLREADAGRLVEA
jgi:hypothetical protein